MPSLSSFFVWGLRWRSRFEDRCKADGFFDSEQRFLGWRKYVYFIIADDGNNNVEIQEKYTYMYTSRNLSLKKKECIIKLVAASYTLH